MVRGFKVFNPDWTCSQEGNTKQYTCPGMFEEEGELAICGHGMHFCENAADCFNYYDFDSDNRVAEVIAYGKVVRKGDKSCTDKLEIVREIPWDEVLRIVNIGKNCTGYRNTGNCNTGNWNTGNCNTGNWNTGDYNTGSCNTGDCNTGDWNTGDYNTGNRNAGNWNTGDWNTGNWNTGDQNAGSCNTGDCNTGDWNTGNRNAGNWNTGDWNTGDQNAGNWNTGDWNTGNRNTGDWNTGDQNTGNRNAGNWNTGDWNTGDWNKSSYNTGCFNTTEQKIMLFNKPSDWTYRNWLQSSAWDIMRGMPKKVVCWIDSSDMSDAEKTANPTHKTTGGYLKVLDESESGQEWWDGLTDKEKDIVMAIPNFDKEIFFQCTGIRVDKN